VSKSIGQIKDLVEVLEISRSLVLNQDLQVLLNQIEQAAASVLNCARATVFVHDPKTSELYSLVSFRPEALRIPADCGIAGECFIRGVIVNVPDAYGDTRFNHTIDTLTGFKTRSVLAAPLLGDRGNILGVLEVLNKNAGVFEKWDEFLLEVLSAQCGIAIHRHALMQDFAERQRLQHELAIAREIQKSLLPSVAPDLPGYDIAGWNQPAEETGGDFFDFHTSGDGNVLTILADVSGHGVGPALLAAECCALQRAVFSLVGDYRLILGQLNQMLCRHIPSDRFITSCAVHLDSGNNTLSFLCAGHGPVYVLRSRENRIETLPVNCLPLGIMEDAPYDLWQTTPFNPDDVLAAFTDGFFEWRNVSETAFGTERICQSLLRNAALSSAEMIEAIHKDLIHFAAGTQQQDDLTAVIIKRLV
jgi:phosphoserine phosphatase RsbU/P